MSMAEVFLIATAISPSARLGDRTQRERLPLSQQRAWRSGSEEDAKGQCRAGFGAARRGLNRLRPSLEGRIGSD